MKQNQFGKKVGFMSKFLKISFIILSLSLSGFEASAENQILIQDLIDSTQNQIDQIPKDSQSFQVLAKYLEILKVHQRKSPNPEGVRPGIDRRYLLHSSRMQSVWGR